VQIDARGQFEWRDFADFSAEALYDLLRFRQAIFVVEQASPYPDLDGLDRRAHHLLLRRDGALAGCARLIPYRNERRVAIGRVAVAVERRGRGLARRIMREALARCRSDYAQMPITLSAQAYLAPFYRSLGFRVVSGPALDYGIEHLEMEREAER
jgi:ElaA protein